MQFQVAVDLFIQGNLMFDPIDRVERIPSVSSLPVELRTAVDKPLDFKLIRSE